MQLMNLLVLYGLNHWLTQSVKWIFGITSHWISSGYLTTLHIVSTYFFNMLDYEICNNRTVYSLVANVIIHLNTSQHIVGTFYILNLYVA